MKEVKNPKNRDGWTKFAEANKDDRIVGLQRLEMEFANRLVIATTKSLYYLDIKK